MLVRVLVFCFLMLSYNAIYCQDNYKIQRIVIDAGHGGTDPGALGKKYKEKDIALDLALMLGNKIQSTYPQIEVLYTRDKDIFIPLFQRISMANRQEADLFISIHCNSSSKKSVHGSETYVMGLHRADENLEVAQRENEVILMENDYEENYEGYDPNSPVGHIVLSSFQDAYLQQSLSVAESVEKSLSKKGIRSSRGVKQAGFAVLRRATMPSVLVETGFLTNKKEEAYLGSTKGKNEISSSIVDALSPFLNLSGVDNSTVIIAPASTSPASTIQENQPVETNASHTVQFAAMTKKLDLDTTHPLNQIGHVVVKEKNGYFKYQIDNISSMDEVKSIQKELETLGYKGSFLVK